MTGDGSSGKKNIMLRVHARDLYAFETRKLDGPPKELIDNTAPMIGYIVISFQRLDEYLDGYCSALFEGDSRDMEGQTLINRSYQEKVDVFSRIIGQKQSDAGIRMPNFDRFVRMLKKSGEWTDIVVNANWEKARDDGFNLIEIQYEHKGAEHRHISLTPECLTTVLHMIFATIRMFDRYDEEMRALYT